VASEKDLNYLLINAFKKRDSFACKISDMPHAEGSKRPLDGFAVHRGYAYYWEAKYLRAYSAFNFNKIRPHQWENLDLIDNQAAFAFGCDGRIAIWSLLVVGIYLCRIGWDVFFFDIEDLIIRKGAGHTGISRAELVYLRDMGLSILARKGDMDVDRIPLVVVKGPRKAGLEKTA
jgi:hypothetical protein